MKRFTIFFVALSLVVGLGVANAYAESKNPNAGLLSQVEQLKSMLKNLENRKSDLFKLENKIETKIDKVTTLAAAVMPKPGKMHVSIQELGNGRSEVNIKNAVVTEISTSTINCITTPCNQPANLKIKASGLAFEIKVDPSSEVLREARDKSNISEFKVGDYVNIFGTQEEATPTIINAKIVRNVSLNKRIIQDRLSAIKNNTGTLCIQVVVWAKNPITGEVKQFPNPCVVPKGWSQAMTDPNTTSTPSTATTTPSTATTTTTTATTTNATSTTQ